MNQIVLSDQKKLKEEKVNEFRHGERPDGRLIGMYRDPFYATEKYYLNPLAKGNVDLILTGSFTNKLFVKQYGKGYLFDSTDVKTGNLLGKYGLDIMGLNQEWFNKRQSEIYKFTLQVQIRKILNGY